MVIPNERLLQAQLCVFVVINTRLRGRAWLTQPPYTQWQSPDTGTHAAFYFPNTHERLNSKC